jgi:thiol peroxidase
VAVNRRSGSIGLDVESLQTTPMRWQIGFAILMFWRNLLKRNYKRRTTMAKVAFKGNEVNTVGELPVVGSIAPDFSLTTGELADVGLDAYTGKKKVLNIVPSLDTGVCAMSAKKFNAEAGDLDGVVVLNISADLPFAAGRFCSAEGIENVIPLSSFRSSFGVEYGVLIDGGALGGLLTRAIVVLDEKNTVLYTELVSEITNEPDYDKALALVK